MEAFFLLNILFAYFLFILKIFNQTQFFLIIYLFLINPLFLNFYKYMKVDYKFLNLIANIFLLDNYCGISKEITKKKLFFISFFTFIYILFFYKIYFYLFIFWFIFLLIIFFFKNIYINILKKIKTKYNYCFTIKIKDIYIISKLTIYAYAILWILNLKNLFNRGNFFINIFTISIILIVGLPLRFLWILNSLLLLLNSYFIFFEKNNFKHVFYYFKIITFNWCLKIYNEIITKINYLENI